MVEKTLQLEALQATISVLMDISISQVSTVLPNWGFSTPTGFINN